MPEEYFVHPSAVVDPGAVIGCKTRVWHFTHVAGGARIGERCSLGQNVYVAPTAVLGDDVKVQNNVSLYDGVVLEDFVFLGPSCVLTNVNNPRAEIPRKDEYRRTLIRRGASVGANATIVCGATVGRYAFVAAGAVITRGEVPDYALMAGVPARRVGWMSRHGAPLRDAGEDGVYVCPLSGWRYQEREGDLRCLDHDEDAPL